MGVYLIGLHGFKQGDFGKVHDFRLATDEAEFLSALTSK